MQVYLFFATFNLNCGLHAVSVGKRRERVANFGGSVFKTESEQIFGFPHTPSQRHWFSDLNWRTWRQRRPR